MKQLGASTAALLDAYIKHVISLLTNLHNKTYAHVKESKGVLLQLFWALGMTVMKQRVLKFPW